MMEISKYSAFETLRSGHPVGIRALRPDDLADLIAAVGRTSAQSLYRRFFGAKKSFSKKEVAFYLNIDFIDHVALVVVAGDGGRPVIVGGGRYIVVQPGTAEVAFAVVDQYQGQGIGAALMRHLAAIARGAGLQELIAEVLPDNVPMLRVFEKGGFRLKRGSGSCTRRCGCSDRYIRSRAARSRPSSVPGSGAWAGVQGG